MADVKLSGHADLAKLMAKTRTWNPPLSLGQYLDLLSQVILTSRYTDMYKELDPRDLQGQLRIKSHRCLRDGELDLEEVVDVGAYAGLLFMRMTPDAMPEVGRVIRKVGSTIEVGTSGQLDQVNKPKPAAPPVKTENRGFLLGLQCPQCQSLAPFDIQTSSMLRMSDERVEQAWSPRWTLQSACRCVKCAYLAKVSNFRIRKPTEKGKKSK